MNKLVSVIIPVYRVASFLERCIESAVCQTYRCLEIILVDDGSDDVCSNICDNWLKIDERIVVVHKKNGGLSEARNYGISIATGEYIFFIDSDDFIAEKTIGSLIVGIADNTDCKMAICEVIKVNQDGKPIESGHENRNVRGIFDSVEIIKRMHEPDGWVYVVAWDKLYHRSLFDHVVFPVGKKCEDEYTAAQFVWYSKRIVLINEVGYFYTQDRTDSIINLIAKSERIRVIMDAYAIRYEFLSENSPQIRQFTKEAYLSQLIKMISFCETSREVLPYVKYWMLHMKPFRFKQSIQVLLMIMGVQKN